jgi:hypothetical protein
VTFVAALYSLFPAWLAVMVHVPALSNVTMLPLTVHTVVVVDANDTGSPDDAVAVNVNVDWVKATVRGSAAKVMVWATFLTVKFRLTFGAAPYSLFPD